MEVISVSSKACSACKAIKDAECFAVDRSKKDGRQSVCRACKRLIGENIERKRERDTARRRANGVRPQREAWDAQRRYSSDAERKRVASRRWREANKDKVAAIQRAWRRKNPEKHREGVRRAMLRNPERIRLVAQVRRSLAKERGRGITVREWRARLAEFGGQCAYCGTVAPLELDHVDPLARGGMHEIENAVPACGRCNRSKHARSIVLWIHDVGMPR